MMNYVATDVVKTVPYMIKAKILKGIALCNLGYISQSITLFHQIIEDKDKVIEVTNPSQFLKETQGSEFSFKDTKYNYRNDLPPEAPENVEVIENLIDTEVNISEKYKISALLESLVLLLKNLIILSTIKDPFDISQTEDMRSKYFTFAEEGIQKVVQVIRNEEEIVKLKCKIAFMKKIESPLPRDTNYLEC